MRSGDTNERVLKQFEKEIVFLERQQTELLRKKWALEDKIRKQQERIQQLETSETEKKKGLSVWKKMALVLAASWALVLSLFSIEKK